jgi:uncharacterized protein YegP (UPF0339 family)
MMAKRTREAWAMRTVVYKDASGDWRWHTDLNGRIVAESGEGYEDKSYAIEAARKFGPRDRNRQ